MVVELIAKDKNEKYQFEGRCKLQIDSISKLMLVEPFIEEYKMISAMFKWKFLAQKNILFVFAEHDFQDFLLIFDTQNLCENIFEHLCKNGATLGNKGFIKERFLTPLFQEISKNGGTTAKLKEILFNWIKQHEGEEKESLIQLLKTNEIYDLFHLNEDNHRSNLGKRKAKDICSEEIAGEDANKEFDIYELSDFDDSDASNETIEDISTSFRTKNKHFKYIIIKKPNFEIINYERNGKPRSRLFIFPSSDRAFCYEYRRGNSKHIYYCCGCTYLKKYMSAKIYKRTNLDVIVRMNPDKHICEMKEYNPEKYLLQETIVKSPNFRIISFFQRGLQKTKLIIFDATNSNLCYEYFWSIKQQLYFCCGCVSRNEKKVVEARICQNGENEYVKLGKAKHICELREFNLQKFVDDKIYYEPDYELFEGEINGKKMKCLYIFADQERKLCYKFNYYKRKKNSYYTCCKCFSSNYTVNASIRKDQSGKEMAVLRMKNLHKCEPVEYIDPRSLQLKTIQAPNFQLVKRKANGKIVQRLAVFDSKDKSLCYEYTKDEARNMFACRPCSKKHKISVYAKLRTNENGEDYVILSRNEHKCALRKFVPENIIPNILMKPDFKTEKYSLKNGTEKLRIYVFDKKKKGYFYVFTWKRNNTYICNPCKKLRKTTSVKLCENESGQNYLEINGEHICESRNKL